MVTGGRDDGGAWELKNGENKITHMDQVFFFSKRPNKMREKGWDDGGGVEKEGGGGKGEIEPIEKKRKKRRWEKKFKKKKKESKNEMGRPDRRVRCGPLGGTMDCWKKKTR